MKKLLLIACSSLYVSIVFGKTTIEKIIDEYNPEYCHLLETTYGVGMMSEGGSKAIDAMFEGLSIHSKKALDIGSGLGGVAYYLAQKYAMEVTGLEINPWMIQESIRKTPFKIENQLNFVLSTDNEHVPFPDNSFDIVYSKGVFCHIENKQGILKECYRVLKPGGTIIINDWLSPTQGAWGSCIQRLITLEGLSLYAETIDGYVQCLFETDFKEIQHKNFSQHYASYNEEIVQKLKLPELKKSFINFFNEQLHQEALDGYSSIAQAMRSGECMVIQFTAYKK